MDVEGQSYLLVTTVLDDLLVMLLGERLIKVDEMV